MTTQLPAGAVAPTLREHLIADGFPIVFDYERSHGSWIVDGQSGKEYLDFYTFFASLPLGFNHPTLLEPESRERLGRAALHKPANSDAHSVELARFTATFAEKAMPAGFRHLFFIEGGALAVENALKAAFDWKTRRNLAAGRGERGSKILHFRQAFHGRSGYTLSLTNTDPIKTAYFPKFDWPRVDNPRLRFPIDAAEIERVAEAEAESVRQIEAAFDREGLDIAAIIIEPIQGEGGDHHFRGEFLASLRRIADEREALLIFDEIQTGFGLTGKMWAWQHFDVAPDIICFGKKAQVCGILAGPRIDEVEDNVFHVSSRINSTWGGGLVDMVRCEIILRTMEEERLVEHVAETGRHLLAGLQGLQEERPELVSNARGRGFFCAFDCPDREMRKSLLRRLFEARMIALPCGERSVRFRPALTMSATEIDEGLGRLGSVLNAF